MSPPSTKHINNNQEYIKQKTQKSQHTIYINYTKINCPSTSVYHSRTWCWMMSTQSQHPSNIQPWPTLDTKPTSLLVSASIPFTEPQIFRKWFAPSTDSHSYGPFWFFPDDRRPWLIQSLFEPQYRATSGQKWGTDRPHDWSMFRIKNEPFFFGVHEFWWILDHSHFCLNHYQHSKFIHHIVARKQRKTTANIHREGWPFKNEKHPLFSAISYFRFLFQP